MLDLDPPPNRPDPSIYSQAARLAAGTTATWDNPDIVLYATPQQSAGGWSMPPGWFLENLLVTVRNSSATVPAINTVVSVSYGPQGIGMPRTPLSTQFVSLGAGDAIQLTIPWPATVRNQLLLRALAVFVDLSHPYDSDLANNQGASSSIIGLISPGAGAFSVPLGNATVDPITYSLSVQPNTVGATVTPSSVTLQPDTTATATIFYGVLGSGTGNTSLTLVAHDGAGNLAGGFTGRLYFG
jgi:hypothetical protein